VIASLAAGELAYCFAVLLFSYSLRGSSGFGSAIGMPLLALVIPVKVLAPAWTLLGVASSIAILGRDRNQVAIREFGSIAPWCAVGVAGGLYFFAALDSQTLARALGLFILIYAAHSFWLTFTPSTNQRASRLLRPASGLLSGAVGTMFGAMASVFFAMYLSESRLAKRAFRATMSAMLLALSLIRAAGYAAVDQLGFDALAVFLAALPAMALGIYLGDRIHAKIDETRFRRLICLALGLCAFALLLQ